MSLTRGQLLYSNASTRVTVFKGLLPPSTPVAIKEQVFDSLQMANSTIQAAIAMSTLANSGVLKVYDCAIEQTEAGFRSVLVLELLESDLAQEIRRRKSTGDYWSDAELITVLRTLVKALSFAQKQGISHNNIQPGSIFLTGSTIKIGNFNPSQPHPSLPSPPLYLSPELKRLYSGLIPGQIGTFRCDPVKADVYSLAVTMVEMASLEQPVCLGNLQQLRQETHALVKGLDGFPHLQYYLTWMMDEEVEKIPTFEELELYIERFAEYYDSLTQNLVNLSQATLIMKTDEEVKIDEIQISPSKDPVETPEMALNPSIPIAVPKTHCAMCTHALPSQPLKLPKCLRNASEYADSVCSLKCLRQIRILLKADEEHCCNCGYIGTFQHPLELKCGHKFHDKDCLFQFIRKHSNDFQRKLTYECPTCARKINYKKVVQPYISKGEVEERKLQWKEVKCCKCAALEVKYEEEGRLYCGKCAESSLEDGC